MGLFIQSCMRLVDVMLLEDQKKRLKHTIWFSSSASGFIGFDDIRHDIGKIEGAPFRRDIQAQNDSELAINTFLSVFYYVIS